MDNVVKTCSLFIPNLIKYTAKNARCKQMNVWCCHILSTGHSDFLLLAAQLAQTQLRLLSVITHFTNTILPSHWTTTTLPHCTNTTLAHSTITLNYTLHIRHSLCSVMVAIAHKHLSCVNIRLLQDQKFSWFRAKFIVSHDFVADSHDIIPSYDNMFLSCSTSGF